MHIALVSPLFESVPPRLYGGTERVVANLAEELISLGHDVTLFASGDSHTRARLRAPCRHALRLDRSCLDPLPHHILQLEMVAEEAHRFDLIHFHTDLLHFPLARRLQTPHITTIHGRLDSGDLKSLYYAFHELPLVSISEHQRSPLPFANWARTIHHGLPLDLLDFHPDPGSYLAFLGRISREKRVDRAIEIARLAGKRLRIAAKVDKSDAEYYQEILPLLSLPHVEFLGEINERQKRQFLGEAEALLFPIDWPEPFGLVMIEAMAAGTPVIAFPGGSVPEIIRDGENGFVAGTVEEAAAAVSRLPEISRRRCREIFAEQFSSRRMAADYVELYEQLAECRSRPLVAEKKSG